MKYKGYKYDGSIERFPVSEGEVYHLPNGSKLQINNIFDEVPEYFKEADCVFIDPPCSKQNLGSFYTKAEKERDWTEFSEFFNRLLHYIDTIKPSRIFVEVFYADHDEFLAALQARYPHVKVYESLYYKKNRCWIIQGSQEPESYPIDGIDETKANEIICQAVPFNCICDFVMGQGLTATSAFKAGKKFVGGELNRNRLAVGIAKVADLGGEWSVVK